MRCVHRGAGKSRIQGLAAKYTPSCSCARSSSRGPAHRRDQAHGGRLAVGAGDRAVGCRARMPVHRRRHRQAAPARHGGPPAPTENPVVAARNAPMRGGRAAAPSIPGWPRPRQRPQGPQGESLSQVARAGACGQRRSPRLAIAWGPPGPFVHFSGGVQAIIGAENAIEAPLRVALRHHRPAGQSRPRAPARCGRAALQAASSNASRAPSPAPHRPREMDVSAVSRRESWTAPRQSRLPLEHQAALFADDASWPPASPRPSLVQRRKFGFGDGRGVSPSARTW